MNISPGDTGGFGPLTDTFRAFCEEVAARPEMFGKTAEHVESVLFGAWRMVVGPRRAWTDPLAACGLLRGNRSLVEDFRQVSWLARYLAEHAAMWPTDPHADGSSDRADSDVANRFLDCWNEERERRLTAEREEYLTRRMMDFAWSIALPGVARRDRGVVESILAAARLEKHNTLARVVAAARALAAGDISAAAELRLAVAALDADPQVDLPSPASSPDSAAQQLRSQTDETR